MAPTSSHCRMLTTVWRAECSHCPVSYVLWRPGLFVSSGMLS